jgi:hypothetical protein
MTGSVCNAANVVPTRGLGGRISIFSDCDEKSVARDFEVGDDDDKEINADFVLLVTKMCVELVRLLPLVGATK